MREADVWPTTVRDRALFDGSAAVLITWEPWSVEIGNDLERGVSYRDGVTALLRLAVAGDDGDLTRSGGGP